LVLHPDPPPRLSSASGFGYPLPLAPSGDLTGGPDGASQVPTRSLCARNGLRPRQSGGASHNGAVHVAFATTDRLGLCNFSDFVAQSHSSHNRCVRFSPAVTGRTCNTRYRAARYALPGRDFHPLDRASFSWRTRCYRNPSNAGSLINYGERFRSGERISSCLAESTVNAVISKRFAKRQQMQWTKRGAHLLLQTRTRTLDGTLRPLFERWYPGLANDNGNEAAQADAA